MLFYICKKKKCTASSDSASNIETGCHFTDPIAFRLIHSTDLLMNLLFLMIIIHFN